jgi:hypothetical protein
MKQDILHLIEEELFQDNIDTEIEDYRIYWTDNFGAENEVYRSQTAVSNNRIAWWQKNEVGKELVRIKMSKDTIINWRPPINTMGLSSLGSSFMKFYKDFLILKYQDKHRERVFVINTNPIQIEEIKGEGYRKNIKLVDNLLYVKGEPHGQITETNIQKENIITKIISGEYLKERKINFDL